MDETKFRNLQIWFFYTFQFSPIEFIPTIEKEFSKFLKNSSLFNPNKNEIEIINAYSQKNSSSSNKFGIWLHQGEEAESHRPYIYLKFPHFGFSSPNFNIKTSFNVNKLNLTYRVNLFSSGIGGFFIVLNLNDVTKLSTNEIIKICKIGEPQSDNIIFPQNKIFDSKQNDLTIFDIFFTIIGNFRKSLCEITEQNIKWKDENIVCPIKTHRKKFSWQEPYLFVFMNSFDRKIEDLNIYNTNIIQILFGENKVPDKRFAHEFSIANKDNSIINFYPFTNILVNFSTRACVIISKEDFNSEEMDVNRENLIRSLGLVRTRWHSYYMTNARIDNKIDKIQKDFEKKLACPEKITISEMKDMYEDYIRTLKDFLNILALEDPCTYSVGTGKFNELYNKGIEKFRIKELQDTIWNKLDNLSKVNTLYQSLDELRRKSEIISHQRKQTTKEKIGNLFLKFRKLRKNG
jgi:hypothetical protein